MKKWIYNIGWVMMAFVTLSLTSCDDDADIARTLEGTWEGNMYAGTDYHGNYYKALYSQVCFLRDPYTYSSGSGYWVDYYDNNYWGNYNYVASHINFKVENREIIIYFIEDDQYAYIYDYSLTDNYFSGTIRLENGQRGHFQLRHITPPNWGGYDRWGYSYYDGYSWSNENALRFSDDDDAKVDNAKAQAPEAPVRVFRDKE